METVNLEGFLHRATPYERWRAPLDPRLRQAVILSGISIATTLVALWTLPTLLSLSDSDFFLVLGPQFGGVLAAMYQARPLLVGLNLTSAAAYVALLAFTRGLRAGRAEWHWAAFGEIAIGAVNGFIRPRHPISAAGWRMTRLRSLTWATSGKRSYSVRPGIRSDSTLSRVSAHQGAEHPQIARHPTP